VLDRTPEGTAQSSAFSNHLAYKRLMDCIALPSFTHTHMIPRQLSTADRWKTATLRKYHGSGRRKSCNPSGPFLLWQVRVQNETESRLARFKAPGSRTQKSL